MNVIMEDIPSKFDLGKKVYAVLGPNRYCHSEITAYRSWAIKKADGILILPNAVRLLTYTLTDYFEDIEQNAVPFCYLTDNEEQVKKWSKVISVDCSDEDWFKAIGQRPTYEEMMQDTYIETRLEESELSFCCANLSYIRDILIKCKEYKGLTVWEVEGLRELCDNVCHEFSEDAPTLKNILEQLNVNWS